jgi:antibiotic biosynthesis monooxygenase (ABM) superfamily enzyme
MTPLFLLGKIVITVGMLAIAFCFFIPKALHFYTLWQQTKKSRDFSLFINCSIWAIFFTSFVYVVAIRASLKIDAYFSMGIERLIISLILTILSIYILVPKILYFFQKWKKSQKHRDFCLSAFFSAVECYCISYIYLLYISMAYG